MEKFLFIFLLKKLDRSPRKLAEESQQAANISLNDLSKKANAFSLGKNFIIKAMCSQVGSGLTYKTSPNTQSYQDSFEFIYSFVLKATPF
jgi:hypothetical protein